MRDPAQPRLGPKPFRPRSPQGQGQYDSGLERDDMPTRKNGHNFNQSNDPSITESDADTEVSHIIDYPPLLFTIQLLGCGDGTRHF